MTKESHPEVAEHFRAYRQDILGFLRSRVATPELADDLLQQTFLRVLQRADWRRIEKPEAYLRTTARHVMADHYRQQGAQKNGVAFEFLDHQHSDETWAPGRAQETHDAVQQLSGALDSMTTRVREAFVLSRVYGYTYAEIGKALSISPRTVEKHVAKGLAQFFEHMKTHRKNGSDLSGVARRDGTHEQPV